ncbi:MAG TPA: circadian clock protein KaiA [Oscillatoriaceae cyanobacterium M33_DOE_052]|uniref:Circadian clock oscillator protein KaiA n=1 Tax=Planktothricoides sp. SpSt-374 TaxID=2282167 RepID=A0A7C3ZJM4_9CYAN|nr:circadian clock protein KaiA [Oscillatoriaceae cyanobacterium M33_DOE_052]
MAGAVSEFLASDRYLLTHVQSEKALFTFLEQEKQQIDCLLLDGNSVIGIAKRLQAKGTLLPAVILSSASRSDSSPPQKPDSGPLRDSQMGELPAGETGSVDESQPLTPSFPNQEAAAPEPIYHSAEVHITKDEISTIARYIEQAITQFLNLTPTRSDTLPSDPPSSLPEPATHFLQLQQRRLAEKLRERLGYLGVYYKRNHQRFLRNLPPKERQEFLESLKLDYCEILLHYFDSRNDQNQKIDEFVYNAFFADISVTQIVEIHMELMDEFSKHLKLEGRSEEILLDYRLTLIDVIAHLCEMYRRSIPRDA